MTDYEKLYKELRQIIQHDHDHMQKCTLAMYKYGELLRWMDGKEKEDVR